MYMPTDPTPAPPQGTPTPAGGAPLAGYVMSDAAEWVRDRWEDFRALGPEILALQHRAAVRAAEARTAGDDETYQKARALILDLGELAQLHLRVEDKIRELGGWIGITLSGHPGAAAYTGTSRSGGLGAIPVPVAVATAFAGVALVMAWLFQRVALQRELVAGLEAGSLTRDDLEALADQPPATNVLGAGLGLAKLALFAFVAWIGWQMLRDVGAMRRNPDLMIRENPGDGGAIIGEHVYSIAYRHAEDSAPYFHDFGPDVEVYGMPDGTVELRHRRGRPLWRDF